MKHFLLLQLILLSHLSFGQPGDIDAFITFRDSIKCIVVGADGDTITSKNMNDKSYMILANHVWGDSDAPFMHLYLDGSESQFCPIDSNGIISSKDSLTINLHRDKMTIRGGWVLQIFHNNEAMKIYIEDASYEELPRFYVVYFTPGYYYLKQLESYYEGGKNITHTLIPLDETQPRSWEGIFKKFQVREKLGM